MVSDVNLLRLVMDEFFFVYIDFLDLLFVVDLNKYLFVLDVIFLMLFWLIFEFGFLFVDCFLLFIVFCLIVFVIKM